MGSASSPARGAARSQDIALHAAILAAAHRHLGELGYTTQGKPKNLDNH